MNRRVNAAASIALLLAGCSTGPKYHPRTVAELNVPGSYGASPNAGVRIDLAVWWASYDDQTLSQLVTTALANNNDIDESRSRLRSARASANGARGALLPSFGASASVSDSSTVNGPGGGDNNYQLGIDASWEADIFGGRKRSLNASKAEASGAEARLYDVQRTISAEVALNYIDARNAQARLAVARGNLVVQDEMLEIVSWRNQAGLVSALDVEQSRVLRAQTVSTIPQLEQAYQASVNRLAVLTGTAPGSMHPLMATLQPIPQAPDSIETGLPADLLHRRPDIVAAERSLAAEIERVGVAQAQLYPSLRLSGTLSSAALTPGDLGVSILSNLLGGVTAPIFQGGQLRAKVEGQKASADAALASYRATVLSALEEVHNALVAMDAAKLREKQFVLAENSAGNSFKYAQVRYQAGLSDFQALLEAQRSLLSAQDSRTAARAARATAAVQLFKALGGGWSPDANISMRPR